jgi:hypothetical protein
VVEFFNTSGADGARCGTSSGTNGTTMEEKREKVDQNNV